MPMTDAELGAHCREILLSSHNSQTKLARFIALEAEAGVVKEPKPRPHYPWADEKPPKAKANAQDEGAEAPPAPKKKASKKKGG